MLGIPKFDKTWLHWGLTSCKRKTSKARCVIKNICKLQVWYRHGIIVYAIFAITHPCDTNTFTDSFTRMYLLLSKMHNIWMGFSWNQNFPFRHNRNFNGKVIFIIIFNKTICWYNFFEGNSFYFLNRFWNVRLSNRCNFILLIVFLLEKGHVLYTSINNREYSYFQFFCFTAKK